VQAPPSACTDELLVLANTTLPPFTSTLAELLSAVPLNVSVPVPVFLIGLAPGQLS